MELSQLHQEVDQKISNIEADMDRFRTNIESCDDAEQRTLLEQDLATLETIRGKLLKAKQITREVTDFRHEVENPRVRSDRIAGVPKWFFFGASACAAAIFVWWLSVI